MLSHPKSKNQEVIVHCSDPTLLPTKKKKKKVENDRERQQKKEMGTDIGLIGVNKTNA